MTLMSTQELTSQIDRVCIPMHGGAHDHDDLLDAVGDRSIVMLGEATHTEHTSSPVGERASPHDSSRSAAFRQ